MRTLRAALVVAVLVIAGACGGADPSWAITATPKPGPPHALLSTGPGGMVLTVGTGSKAVVRVREQLAGLVSTSDAILAADGVTGRIAVRRDGTFVPGSRVVVTLNDLRSDNAQRDRFIKQETLETPKYPLAEFTPTRATGLSLPLRTAGEVSFKLTGTMVLHGTSREVTFDVTAARVGSGIQITAKNATQWRFADFDLRIPQVFTVLSIVDDIRLEVQIIGTDVQG